MASQNPTPEWAEEQAELILKGYDAEQIDAFLELLVAIAPSKDEEKYKHEIAWAAIEYGYKRTEDCRQACRRYLDLAG